jgi:hypothetical protein
MSPRRERRSLDRRSGAGGSEHPEKFAAKWTPSSPLLGTDPPGSPDREAATFAHETLAAYLKTHPCAGTVPVRLGDDTVTEVPARVLALMLAALRELGAGHVVQLVSADAQLDAAAAARLLGVTPSHLVEQMAPADLPDNSPMILNTDFLRSPTVRLADVLTYREALAARRAGALDDLVADSEDLGLYDDED